jgi:hypothetical protein
MIVRTTSHRSRKKLDVALGRHPQYYYTFNDSHGGCYVKLTDHIEINKALAIKGINKSRNQNEEDYHACWEVK